MSPAPPTLYRYPGPCGLGELLGFGALPTLGPPGVDELWLSEASSHADVPGARCFGTLALLTPERFGPRPAGIPGKWIGHNRPLTPADLERLRWVPPSRVGQPLPRSVLLQAHAAERRRVTAELFDYLEELSALHRAGAPGPGVPWCSVAPQRRRRLLADFGVRPRWTGLGVSAALAA